MSAQDLEQRAQFEEWVRKRHGLSVEVWDDSGKYKYGNTHHFWECWKVAAALRQQPAPVVDDALRKDAERYRWLRENAGAWEVSKDAAEWTKCETGEKFKPRVYFTAFSTGYGGMLLDDALDAAMKGANA